MSDQERYQIAKEYLDEQCQKMEKNGLRVRKVSSGEYDEMVRRLARDVESSNQPKSETMS